METENRNATQRNVLNANHFSNGESLQSFRRSLLSDWLSFQGFGGITEWQKAGRHILGGENMSQ